jgi:hypothetical protein
MDNRKIITSLYIVYHKTVINPLNRIMADGHNALSE